MGLTPKDTKMYTVFLRKNGGPWCEFITLGNPDIARQISEGLHGLDGDVWESRWFTAIQPPVKSMEVISEKRTMTDGRLVTKFEMITNIEPTNEDVRKSQGRLGYSSVAYGDPWRIHREKVKDTIKTTWQCAGSCD